MLKVDQLLSLHPSAITTHHSLAQTLYFLLRHINKFPHLQVTKLKFEEANHTIIIITSSTKVLKKLKDIQQVVGETLSFSRLP